ncbi:hypothetical protein [Bacteroides sp.]|uniref:hypothetical protein n=1 Tax=Bacteroides sp. TaxID=29523 RepID=UPI003A8F8404
MENEKKTSEMMKVFTFLMKRVYPGFTFPGGEAARRTVTSCVRSLENGGRPDAERMVNFCVCQVYALSNFGENYRSRWNVSHSFGKRAMRRFAESKREIRFYEDKWLRKHELSREMLCELIRDRSRHPQAKFIYPRYEDATKKRLVGTMPGYYICGASTLLWTPFSPVCTGCPKAAACQQRTRMAYPELYRIRVEEFKASRK